MENDILCLCLRFCDISAVHKDTFQYMQFNETGIFNQNIGVILLCFGKHISTLKNVLFTLQEKIYYWKIGLNFLLFFFQEINLWDVQFTA